MASNRREFIKLSSLILGAIIYPGKNLFGFNTLLSPSGIKEIRPGTGIFTSEGGTIGWYVSDDAVVVIDTQFPESAKIFWGSLKVNSERKINVLFNTHHHGDHTSGNYYLKDFAERIVAQENCPVLQKKFYGKGETESQQVYADTTFKNDWEFNLGKERLKAYHFGSAHTAGDAFLHFENSNVVHMGDLVFNKVYPYMDRPAGCLIEGSIETLGKAATMFDKDTIFIFGHANSEENATGSVNDLITMKNYFSALLDFVNKEMKVGKTLDEIKKSENIPGYENLVELWNGAKDMNLQAAYEELSS